MVKIKKLKTQPKEDRRRKISKSKALVEKTSKSKKIKQQLEYCFEQLTEGGKDIQAASKKFTQIDPEIVEKALKGILKFHSENPKLKDQLFDEEFPIFLQISCYKIPKGHSKIFRIPLAHSLYNAESEICLILSEIKGIKNSEHDQHKEHYEKLLSDKGIDNIKGLMTFHEFRTDYETFEQKNRLVDRYDIFLADSKISGKVVKKAGKIFYKKRKVPIPVKLQVTKLKEHIENTLSKTFFHVHLKGNSYTVQIGHSKMTIKALKENIQSVQQFLEKDFPGGFSNVMGINVFAPRVSSIPIYFSTSMYKNNIRMLMSSDMQIMKKYINCII